MHAPAVKTEHGRRGLASGWHADKCQSDGSTATAMRDHIRGFHVAEQFKNLAQVVSRDTARQIPYADIHSEAFSLCTAHPCFGNVPDREK